MRNNEEIIKPFLLCCESKNTKLTTLALSALHKLVSHSAVPDGGISIIIETLYRLLGETDEVVQLKIYQLGLVTLTSNLDDMNQQTLSRFFSICFQLLENKSVPIQQTGTVTLRQACSVIFESAQKKKSECALLLLVDLTHFAANEPGKWIRINTTPSKTLILELLENISDTYPDVLMGDQYQFIISDRILPLVFSKFSEFGESLQIMRLATCLTRKYTKIIKNSVVKVLNVIVGDIHTPWKRVLALECVRVLFEDQKFLESLNDIFDYKKDNMFDIMIQLIRDSIEKYYPEKFIYKIRQFDRLAGVNATEAFTPLNDEILSLCLDSVNGLSKSIAAIIGMKDIITSNVKKSHCNLLEATWVGVLSCLSEMLEKSSEDDTVQVILRSYLLYTIISGVTDLSTPRDAFLTSLCSYTLPMDPNEQNLSPKHLQVSKVLFNIAHIIGEYLGSSWYVLLKNFQKLDKFLRPNEKDSSTRQILEGNQSLSNLAKDLSSLFSDTKNFKIESLSVLLKQLINLSEDSNFSIFADTRLIENIQINLFRVEEFWDMVEDHLVQLVLNQNTTKFGIESITAIVSASCTDAMTSTLQFKLFETFLKITKDNTRRFIIISLTSIIQKSGQMLTVGWDPILKILQDASQRENEISIGFKCVQLIGNDFLPTLTHHMQEYISTVACFTKQTRSDDVNTNLVAIGLFMTIGDFLQSCDLKNLNELWLNLFEQLVGASTDLRYEVRNSAIKTLTFAIASQGKILDQTSWEACVNKVILPILIQVHEHASQAELTKVEAEGASSLTAKTIKKMYIHHSRDTVGKQWGETRRLVIEGFSRIFVEHASVLSKLNSYTQFCEAIISFFTNSARTESQEIAHAVCISLFELISLDKDVIWIGAWRIWREIGEKAVRGGPLDKQTPIFLVEGFVELNNKKLLTLPMDVEHSIEICEMLFTAPLATSGIQSPSRIQEVILNYFQQVSNPKIFDTLLNSLPSRDLIMERKNLPQISFCVAIIKHLISGKIYSFEKLIKAIGILLSTRKYENEYPVWKNLVKPFEQLILTHQEKIENTCWINIANIVEEFIFFEKPSDEEEIILLNLIEKILTNKPLDDELRRKLLILTISISKLSPKLVAGQAIKVLFTIVSNVVETNQTQLEVARVLVPMLLSRCREILEAYLKDDKKIGNLPLPRYRRDEVLNIFCHLRVVEVNPILFDGCKGKQECLNGKRGLVVRLFSILCEFVGAKEDSVFKNELLDLMRIVARELGLND